MKYSSDFIFVNELSDFIRMSATQALNLNSNNSTDPLRHNFRTNGVISQNNNKTTMAYSPLALANSINVNNNNSHINNNNSSADNSSGWFSFEKKIIIKC